MALQELTIEEYREEFESKQEYQLIDVREINEWLQVRLPGTINIPMSQFQARIDEIDPDTAIILVCQTASRSEMVGNFLVANGYENVYNLLEGTMGWLRRGLPAEQG